MESFSIQCPPYYEDIQFCITENKDEAKKYFEDTFKINVGEKCDSVKGYCVRNKDSATTFIWIPKLPETAIEFGNLHHEVYHAVCFMLESRGIEDRGEPYAYLLGYIINAFYNLYPPIRKHDFSIFGRKIWIK